VYKSAPEKFNVIGAKILFYSNFWKRLFTDWWSINFNFSGVWIRLYIQRAFGAQELAEAQKRVGFYTGVFEAYLFGWSFHFAGESIGVLIISGDSLYDNQDLIYPHWSKKYCLWFDWISFAP